MSVTTTLCDLVEGLVASAARERNRHVNTSWGRRAELFGAGDGLRNRHCSPRILARFLSLLDFSCALVLRCPGLPAVFEHKATETRAQIH